jgi:hypothetical protein
MKNDGKKFDDGKPRYDLIPPAALHEFVEVLTFGAKKYAPDGWRKVPERRWRYFAAAMRHIWAWWRGESRDPESQRHHLAHALCCIFFLLEEALAPWPEKEEPRIEITEPVGLCDGDGVVHGSGKYAGSSSSCPGCRACK